MHFQTFLLWEGCNSYFTVGPIFTGFLDLLLPLKSIQKKTMILLKWLNVTTIASMYYCTVLHYIVLYVTIKSVSLLVMSSDILEGNARMQF